MTLVQLTLVAPRQIEDALLEVLYAHPEWAAGFTLIQAEGHSSRPESLTAHERVRGRAARFVVVVVLEEALADALLDHLKSAFPRADVAWWMNPVHRFGRLA